MEILCIIVKHLLGLLMNENKWMRLYYSVKHYLFLWMLMFAAILLIFESMIKDIAFLVLAGMLGTLIAMHLLAGYKSEVRAIVKLRNIVQS